MKTLDEILAPFRMEVEAKGYSEEELADLFTEARKEVFQTKLGAPTNANNFGSNSVH